VRRTMSLNGESRPRSGHSNNRLVNRKYWATIGGGGSAQRFISSSSPYRTRRCSLLLDGVMSVELECDASARRASLRPGRATTVESAVFKFGPLIWQRFFGADGTDSAGDAPPIKSMRHESLEATFGRGRLSRADSEQFQVRD